MKGKDLTLTALFTAVFCVVAPFSVPLPFGGVPLTLGTLALYLAAASLGLKRGTLATLCYLLLGGFGLPVFSGFTAGFGRLAGPTGGYLVGYLGCAAIVGFFADRFEIRYLLHVAGMALGTLLLYVFGTAWYMVQAQVGLLPALLACVLPFLPGDALKICAAAGVSSTLRRRLRLGAV